MTTGVTPLDQRRVSVVCRSTRVDVSVPAHLELVAIIPHIVELVRAHIRTVAGPGQPVDIDGLMGADGSGSWQLSRLAGSALSVSETLSQQRVHDGEILVLEYRPVPTPAPLFDDVVHGVTEPVIAGHGQWSRSWTQITAVVTVVICALCSAGAILRHWWDEAGYVPPVVSAALAAAAVVAVVASRTTRSATGTPFTATLCAVGFSALTALTAVPGEPAAGHVLAAASCAAVVAVVLRVTLGARSSSSENTNSIDYAGLDFNALCLAVAIPAIGAALGAATVSWTLLEAAAVAAGLAVPGLVLVTAAPPLAVRAGRIPLQALATTPTSAPDEHESHSGDTAAHRANSVGLELPQALPTVGTLRHRAAASRSWLTGVLAGGAALLVGGVVISLTGPESVTSWTAPLAGVVAAALVLRALTYADRVHVAVLLGWALTLVLAILVGTLVTADSPIMVVIPLAVVIAVIAIVAHVRAHRVGLSPLTRRAIGIVEVLLITSIVPLALGAVGIYSLIRHRS